MKTYNDIDKISFNDYAFFKGVEISEAKWAFANIINGKNAKYATKKEIKQRGLQGYFEMTETGLPRVSMSERLHKDMFNFTMTSNSNLDGECQMKYLCDFYNKGVPINLLREYSENSTYRKALKFTGKKGIVNEIILPEQLEKLQRTWLFSNTYEVKFWSKNTIEFIEKIDWATPHLLEKNFSIEEIEEQIERVKNPDQQEVYN